MDDGNEVVAWLALLVAALSLFWQVVSARARSRTRLRVVVRHGAVSQSLNGDQLLAIPALGLDVRPFVWGVHEGEPLAYVIVVVVINDGETTEAVSDVRVLNHDRRQGAGADDGTGPRGLPPRDRVTWALRADRLAFDLADGFFVVLALASGKGAESGPCFLDDGLLDHIAQHNAGQE